MRETLDDRTVAYILETRRPFEDLRQVASQLDAHENLRGTNRDDPQYVPVGLATGSQFNPIMTSEEMVTRAGGDPDRVIPVHEEGLRDLFPSRIAKSGLRITELALADGEPSRVR
jgi:N-acyl homoserine lactone hydrolase